MNRLDRETGRDRYFEARDRELEGLLDPATGRLAEELAEEIDCPLCGSGSHSTLFEKQGFTFVRCDECALVFVNPQVREEVLLGEYRTAATNDLWFDVLTSERQLELDRKKFGEILELLNPYRSSGRLLDVGCSIGLFLELARERGWEGVGLEPASRARAHARDVYGLDVRSVPLTEASFERATFDAVTLLSVLEHTTDPRGMLAECARVLRPGGALYVVVPNVESLACRVLREGTRTFDGRNHLVYFSSSTLTALLETAGFEANVVTTKVSSLEPVLRHLSFEEPYGGTVREPDALSQWVGNRLDEVDGLIEELGLGYKLHCLATKRT
jgi:2-polyprenyl-3-methyl-5-hydroxy-6-metoxy-1,4-benzoquinol methylase